jgi:predicted P-loop ATPase
MSDKLTKRQKTENWLSEKYFVRYNTIKYCVEFARITKSKNPVFSELTDRDMNTMLREIDANTDIAINGNLLYSVLTSAFAKDFNPINDYFESLNFKDAELDKEYTEIEKLSDCVFMKHTEHTKVWKKVFKHWLVSCVANSLTPVGCQNQTCLVFTGTQGGFKTTFLNSLCPPALKEYLYSSSLDLKSKDTFIMLGQNFIINIDDQLESLFKQDAEMMKTLITSKENKRRLPHAKFVQNIARIANFCGSINHTEFLRDSSGNRRFLPFEIKSILIDYVTDKINIDKVWFEAYQLFLDSKKENGFRYWFTKEELNEMFGGFENFYVVTPEEEVLNALFEIPTEKHHLNHLFKKLMPIEVEKYIQEAKISSRIQLKVIAQVLKKKGCLETTRTGGKRCFWLRPKDGVEREAEQQYNPYEEETEERKEEVKF